MKSETDMQETGIEYNNAKLWQIGCFSLNNFATNLYLAMMAYVSYYANGVAGFGVVFVSVLLTGLNVFDGITDPIVGYFLDKTNGKYGKFRPFMLIGNLLMGICVCFLFLLTHRISSVALRIFWFVFFYMGFIVGYTFQTVVGKSGQTVLTNNPKQRPVSTYFDSLYMMAAYGGTALYVSNYLVKKYGELNSKELFLEFSLSVAAVSFLATLLAIWGIWEKDRMENFHRDVKKQVVRIRDYVDILCHNRPIAMLIIAACTDKFAATVYSHTTVGVMLFGIMMQDYKIAGLIGVVTAIPTLLVVIAGIRIAQALGQKKALVSFTAGGIVLQTAMLFLLCSDQVSTIRFSLKSINGITVVFFWLFVFLNGCKSITNNMVIPMIADCSDYEVYRSGKYVPGLMGALFSFVDKIFTALGTGFVGFMVALIGFKEQLPQISDPLTPQVKWMTLFLYCGTPVIGWILTLIAMKYYHLDKNQMYKIQKENRKKNAEPDGS